jgi:antitoxin ParD1/3/4
MVVLRTPRERGRIGEIVGDAAIGYSVRMNAEPKQTLTISLTPDQAKRMQRAIESGEYASGSEVVQDALGLWAQREDLRTLEAEALKKAYDEGRASGPGRTVDAETLLAELKAERRARG